MSKFLCWLVFEGNLKLGKLAPYVLGLALGRWPRKVIAEEGGVKNAN